jgi:hypothetical protein
MVVIHLVSKFPTLYETVTYTDFQKSPPKNRVLNPINQVHLLKPYLLRLIKWQILIYASVQKRRESGAAYRGSIVQGEENGYFNLKKKILILILNPESNKRKCTKYLWFFILILEVQKFGAAIAIARPGRHET